MKILSNMIKGYTLSKAFEFSEVYFKDNVTKYGIDRYLYIDDLNEEDSVLFKISYNKDNDSFTLESEVRGRKQKIRKNMKERQLVKLASTAFGDDDLKKSLPDFLKQLKIRTAGVMDSVSADHARCKSLVNKYSGGQYSYVSSDYSDNLKIRWITDDIYTSLNNLVSKFMTPIIFKNKREYNSASKKIEALADKMYNLAGKSIKVTYEMKDIEGSNFKGAHVRITATLVIDEINPVVMRAMSERGDHMFCISPVIKVGRKDLKWESLSERSSSNKGGFSNFGKAIVTINPKINLFKVKMSDLELQACLGDNWFHNANLSVMNNTYENLNVSFKKTTNFFNRISYRKVFPPIGESAYSTDIEIKEDSKPKKNITPKGTVSLSDYTTYCPSCGENHGKTKEALDEYKPGDLFYCSTCTNYAKVTR